MPTVAGRENGRVRLPGERKGITHRAMIGGVRVYITVGLFPDGRPGEVFLKADKMGSLTSGLLDGIAIAISIGLQYGVPLEVFVSKFSRTNFLPDGFTGPEFGYASSIMDYVSRWLGARFPANGKPANGNGGAA